MGKKKKADTSKAKTHKNAAAIEERWKKVTELQPPELNPYKQENERKIERFLRYGVSKRKRDVPLKVANRHK